MLENTPENPLDSKEIKPVNPKGNQPRTFIGRTSAGQKLQYFDHLIQRADSLEKTLMLEKAEGRRRGDDRGWDSIIDSMKMNFNKLQEMGKVRGAWYATVHGGHKKSDTT